jgi:hypothetical protein
VLAAGRRGHRGFCATRLHARALLKMRELNLSGMWNVVTFALRRWLTDDGVWPKVVAPVAVFVRNSRAPVDVSVAGVRTSA